MNYDYEYAIAALNVQRARLAIAIDKWDNEILQSGPEEMICKWYNEAKEKFEKIEAAITRLRQTDHDIIEANGICPFCKIDIHKCESDHK